MGILGEGQRKRDDDDAQRYHLCFVYQALRGENQGEMDNEDA